MRRTGELLPDESPPEGWEAHHIVAWRMKEAAPAQAVLAWCGISIHSPENGVLLPGNPSVPNPTRATVHSVYHADVRKLEFVNSTMKKLRESEDKSKCDATLADLETMLRTGRYPLVKQ